MKLNNIPKSRGAVKRSKRLGAGKGSGLGKTCGRGQKGSGARSGYSTPPGFEGGQMPLYRKLPRRGFNNKNFRQEYEIINLASLDAIEAAEIDREVLVSASLIGKSKNPLKVLAHGDVTKAITVKADKFSASAKAKIEAAGGKAIVIEAQKKTADEDSSSA